MPKVEVEVMWRPWTWRWTWHSRGHGREGGGGMAEAMDVDARGGGDIEQKREQPTTCLIECFKDGNLTRLKMW